MLCVVVAESSLVALQFNPKFQASASEVETTNNSAAGRIQLQQLEIICIGQ